MQQCQQSKKTAFNRTLVTIATSIVLTFLMGAFQHTRNQVLEPATENGLIPILVQKNDTRRIQFEPGTTSAVIEDALARGNRNIYLLGAREGQIMKVEITSTENNAVFDFSDPDGEVLLQESFSWQGVLPATGDYKLIIGGMRGNVNYRLEVIIK